MFDTIYTQVGVAVTVLVIAGVFLKGDEPERIGGAAFVLGSLAYMLVGETSLGDPRWGKLGIDIILLAVFVGLAWHYRRGWPVWACAFQSLIVTGHLILILPVQPPGAAFAAVNNLSSYGVLISLAVGTFWAWQERRAAAIAAGDI